MGAFSKNSSLRIMAAQTNPVVGDVAGNAAQHRAAWAVAGRDHADLVVFPEMSLAGYPPDDLALNPDFLAMCNHHVQQLAMLTHNGPAILLGAPYLEKNTTSVPPLNAAWLLADGEIKNVVGKRHLPTYEEFYDARVFSSAVLSEPMMFRGHKLGVMICEDLWFPDIAQQLAAQGAEVLITLNASPFAKGKAAHRLNNVLRARVRETNLPLLYVNMVGGQDELVFDGGSLALQRQGDLAWQAPFWQENNSTLTLEKGVWEEGVWEGEVREEEVREEEVREKSLVQSAAPPCEWQDIYQCLMLAVRDYWRKNGFTRAVVGLSGGIDSGLVLTLLADALGPDHVMGVRLPSPFTSDESQNLAAELAKNIGVRLVDMPISEALPVLHKTLARGGMDPTKNITPDNIQSRLRGLLLMAITNAEEKIMLASTGNKSEIALGYCTLYGDTNGGFNPLKDVYKTEVFQLARWRNQHVPASALGPAGEAIPLAMITRPPTAETRAGQTDEGSLGYSYALIDQILSMHIDDDLPAAEIAGRCGHTQAVEKILRMVRLAQYKRQQACPGPKISRRAFGRSRQYPIVNHFDPPLTMKTQT